LTVIKSELHTGKHGSLCSLNTIVVYRILSQYYVVTLTVRILETTTPLGVCYDVWSSRYTIYMESYGTCVHVTL